MHLSFRTRTLRTTCESVAPADVQYGASGPSLRARLADLRAADRLPDLPLGYEPLAGSRAARIALTPSGWIHVHMLADSLAPLERTHRIIVTDVEGVIDA